MWRLIEPCLSVQVETEQTRERRILHLQGLAVRRLLKRELARGWLTWHAAFVRNQSLLRRSAGCFRNRGLFVGMAQWKSVLPPRVHTRAIAAPLEQEIAELTKALATERTERGAAQAKLDEAMIVLNDLGITLTEEREHKVAHLQQMAIRRLMMREMARGWTTWQQLWAHNRFLVYRAVARFRNVALFASLRRWKATHPPRDGDAGQRAALERSLSAAEEALARERARHHSTREDALFGAAKESAKLRAVVRELQNVLSQAMKATSWTACRKVRTWRGADGRGGLGGRGGRRVPSLCSPQSARSRAHRTPTPWSPSVLATPPTPTARHRFSHPSHTPTARHRLSHPPHTPTARHRCSHPPPHPRLTRLRTGSLP